MATTSSTPIPDRAASAATGTAGQEDLDLAAELAYYDDMAQGLQAETDAMQTFDRVPVQALPARQYLDATVVPLLLHGLQAIATEQPQDPIEYLAAFLISNNPQRDPTLPAPPGNALLRGLVPPPPPPPAVTGPSALSATPAV